MLSLGLLLKTPGYTPSPLPLPTNLPLPATAGLASRGQTPRQPASPVAPSQKYSTAETDWALCKTAVGESSHHHPISSGEYFPTGMCGREETYFRWKMERDSPRFFLNLLAPIGGLKFTIPMRILSHHTTNLSSTPPDYSSS